MAQKYVAYVGSYTYYGSSKGISIMDVDVEKGIFTKRKEVSVNNSSYLVASRNKPNICILLLMRVLPHLSPS